MNRCIEPELLDSLPSDEPRAMRCRRDLRRVNAWMRNARILEKRLKLIPLGKPPNRITEIGAGDGTFMLSLARRLATAWRNVEVVLIDHQNVIDEETHLGFEGLGWNVRTVGRDVFEWFRDPLGEIQDIILANLFLHHFESEALAALLRQVAERTRVFVACEPRRSPVALAAAHALWLIGCNDVTRHDAPISVRAGFRERELSNLWGASSSGWTLTERSAGLFSHLFCASRKDASETKRKNNAYNSTFNVER